MRLLVTDTETTGDGDRDQIVELAVRGRSLDENGNLQSRWQYQCLIRPTCSVDPRARASHHLTDEELAHCKTMRELLDQGDLLGGLRGPRSVPEDDRVLVAHFAAFDRRMIVQTGDEEDLFLPPREICTWKCALHLWPDAPSHKNQVLRYWLNLDVPRDERFAWQPHRAAHDALVTDLILDKLLALRTAEELIELTKTPVLLSTCRIGEHSGKPWREVPESFLKWLLGKGPRRPNPKGGRDIGFSEDERHTARYWLGHHQIEFQRKFDEAKTARLMREGKILPSTVAQGILPLPVAVEGKS